MRTVDRETEIAWKLGRYYCRRCAEKGIGVEAEERSDGYGIYCGMLCDACWAQDSRRDFGRTRFFDAADAGERLDDDY